MQIANQAQYEQAKANLEAVGFTNLPAPASIDWTATFPCQLNANMNIKQHSTVSVAIALAPVG